MATLTTSLRASYRAHRAAVKATAPALDYDWREDAYSTFADYIEGMANHPEELAYAEACELFDLRYAGTSR